MRYQGILLLLLSATAGCGQSGCRNKEQQGDAESAKATTPSNLARSVPHDPPAGHVGPWLAEVTLTQAELAPAHLRFSVRVRSDAPPAAFDKKATLWFCLGKPGSPSFRAVLEEQMKPDPLTGNPRALEGLELVNGTSYVAVPCRGFAQSEDGLWTGEADLGKMDLRGEKIEITSVFGADHFPAAEMPVSWVLWDGNHVLSNELRAVINLKTGQVVGVASEKQK